MIPIEDCPKCLGSGEVMQGKATRGFEYVECTLCKGKGKVETEIAKDYIFAQGGEEDFGEEYINELDG